MSASRFNPPPKLKSFSEDIAPIGFYFDIFPTELFQTPILPVPMRIDKVSNGEPTLIITPNIKKLARSCKIHNVHLNMNNFYLIGIQNFINFAKVKVKELILRNLEIRKIRTWWEASKILSACNLDLTESFTFINLEFVKIFNLIKENDLNPSEKEYTNILISYCEVVANYFKEKIEKNVFVVHKENKISIEKLYIEKKNKFYPMIVKIPVYNEISHHFHQMEFIPYLIYDDLLEVFFYNGNLLRNGDKKAINLKVYEDTQIINTRSANLNIKSYENTTDLNDLNIDKLLD